MPLATNSDTVAGLMARFRQGNREAAGQLVELFYPELRRLAAARMRRERTDHTWQPTALVNELYFELVKIKALSESSSNADSERKAFLSLSAHLMKRLLIHHARPLSKRSKKEEVPDLPDLAGSGAKDLAEIENALDRLAAINPKLRTVVELRVFDGLTGDETAERMQCAPVTVARHWSFARQWLAEEFART
jgi:RNA polymerase sigma factor (TIGR02999 family)